MESDLGGWSGVRNPNNFTLGVHPQDLKNMGQVLNSALAQMAETEEADNNRLFREIKSPRGAGTTHQERLNNYIASRERLEALQGAAGIAVSRDPQRLAEENAGRKRYGMPELPVSQESPEGASSRDTRRAPSSVPYGNAGISDYRRLSDVDCRGAMNNAVRGGTTVMVGNRLDVSPADIHKTVKDFMNSQTERPDISNWNVSSLRQLSRDVGQEYRNQMMTAKLAVDGIAAGGDPRTLTENITNPRVRELIVNQARPGMTDQDLTKIRDGVTGEMGFADKNMAIVREMAAASQDERMQRRAVAAECAPGS